MKLKDIAYPKRNWRIPSRSDVGVYHTVELWTDGSLECDCIAGAYRRECYHKILIRKHLQKNEPETYEKLKKPRQRAKRKN